jgi:hypothetical protein
MPSSGNTIQVYVYLLPNHNDIVIEKHGLIIQEEEYHAAVYDPEWLFEMDGFHVSVRFPEGPYTDSHSTRPFEKVLNAFDFEVITYSPTAETNPVQ